MWHSLTQVLARKSMDQGSANKSKIGLVPFQLKLGPKSDTFTFSSISNLTMSKIILQEVQQGYCMDEAVEVVASISVANQDNSAEKDGGLSENQGIYGINPGSQHKEAKADSMMDATEHSANENLNKQNQRTGGCKCKKSACLMKFCECVQQRTHCGEFCKCFNCGYQPKQDQKTRPKKV
jgi:hypothetical protein